MAGMAVRVRRVEVDAGVFRLGVVQGGDSKEWNRRGACVDVAWPPAQREEFQPRKINCWRPHIPGCKLRHANAAGKATSDVGDGIDVRETKFKPMVKGESVCDAGWAVHRHGP
jgi:hypothetical protein